MKSARAFWIDTPWRSSIREVPLGSASPGEVLIETVSTRISRGTELLVYSGRVPESEYERMRAPFQQGDFPGPIKYGYANVGRVIAGDECRVGELVFCLFPHQDRFLIDEKDAHPLPAGLPTQRATLAANMETALNAIWDAQPLPGDAVTIVGAGTLGWLLCSLLTRQLALDVEVVDLDTTLASVAESFGVRFADPDTARGNRDIVFHTSASSNGLTRCLQLCGAEAKIIELSWFGSGSVAVPLGADFHHKRLTLKSSQVGTVSPRKRGFDFRRRLRLALMLLNDDRLDALTTGSVAFEQLPAHFENLSAPSSSRTLPLTVHYPAGEPRDS